MNSMLQLYVIVCVCLCVCVLFSLTYPHIHTYTHTHTYIHTLWIAHLARVTLGKEKRFRGIPQQPGKYLVALSKSHIDGLIVMPNRQLQFFPSNPNISRSVLTENHNYVQTHFYSTKKYMAIQIHECSRLRYV